MKLEDLTMKTCGMRTSADTKKKLKLLAAIQNQTYEKVLNELLSNELEQVKEFKGFN